MKLFLLIIMALGVIAIYDARKIVNKYFSSQDQNKSVTIIKIIGFILFCISGIILCFLH